MSGSERAYILHKITNSRSAEPTVTSKDGHHAHGEGFDSPGTHRSSYWRGVNKQATPISP